MCPLDRVLTYKNLIYLLNLQFYCVNTSYPMDNGKGECSPPSTLYYLGSSPPRLPKSRNGVNLDPTGRCVPHSGHLLV